MTNQGADDPHTVLGVAHGADDATITAAYRLLARTYHPDIAGDDATAKMTLINIAFDTIGRRDARAAHDAGVSGTAAGTRRTSRTRERDGTGGAGPAPGRPSGSVLDFGRHIGWSMGEIARVDPGYLAWLSERREGRPYLDEIEAILRRVGYWKDPTMQETAAGDTRRRGRFGRLVR